MFVRTTIDQLVFGGQGLGKSQDRVVFAWNALPGEDVNVLVTRKNRKFYEGIAEEVFTPSPDRIDPREVHYMSCSPWQILPPVKENEWKKTIALETYQRIGQFVPENVDLVYDGNDFGYRNKMEYSFTQEAGKPVSLAFFERGQHHKTAISGCALASPAIEAVAARVMRWIFEQKIPIRSLKSLIIRSNRKGQTIAGLFIKDRLPLKDIPAIEGDWLGFRIFLSNYRSPASVIDDTLHEEGLNAISETVNGVPMQYGLMSFFQVNVPVFEQAVQDIGAALLPSVPVVDFYAGVGAISLALQKQVQSAELVDSNREGIEFAKKNITMAGLNGFTAHAVPAENMTEVIGHDKVVIVDPPRAGLHDDITRVLLEKQPKRIIYLSCNISTQARDLQRLSAAYRVTSTKVYNFFPRTPHIEALCVFDRIA